MSQCHDVYEPSDFSGVVPGVGRHGCHFVNQPHGQVGLVRVVGSLDWTNEAEFSELIHEQCKARVLIVDLTAGRIDAAGMGALVLATEQARERHQRLVLVATDPVQRSAMISIGLNIVVPIVSSVEEAVTWCERHGIPTWTVPAGPALDPA